MTTSRRSTAWRATRASVRALPRPLHVGVTACHFMHVRVAPALASLAPSHGSGGQNAVVSGMLMECLHMTLASFVPSRQPVTCQQEMTPLAKPKTAW